MKRDDGRVTKEEIMLAAYWHADAAYTVDVTHVGGVNDGFYVMLRDGRGAYTYRQVHTCADVAGAVSSMREELTR